MPREPIRTLRVEDELWLPAQAIAKARGESLSAVMRAALVRYVARHQAITERSLTRG